ncbi:MAG TPA: CarD family transcriptional regulator [Hyphomicrobiaceae bacterium]|nr:CarD family transcriptional regulator [Hyphomicrobiaceae bacterium]
MAQKKKVPAKVRMAKAAATKRTPRAAAARAAAQPKTVGKKVAGATTKSRSVKVKARAPQPKQAQLKAAPAKVQPARTTVKAVAQSATKPPAVSKPIPSQAEARAAETRAAVEAIQARRAAGVATASVPAGAVRPSAPATPKDLAAKAAEAHRQLAASKKPVGQRHGFKTNEYIVYPAHGVGRIVGIEEQEIAGMALELFVINFEKDKMTLRVPTGKLQSVGMRKLSDPSVVHKAMETLKGRARIKRTMWSRRAQEYEAKINSGDLVAIAEVVRDLYRSESQPEQSYSERQLYEAALDRMAREIAVVEKIDDRGAVQRITEVLSKSARGRRAAAEGGDAIDAEVKAA